MSEQTATAQDETHAMPANGTFCWNELSTSNLEEAKKFYTALLGWTLKESKAAGMVYNEIVAGGREAGGMYQMGAECGGDGNGRSQWITYVAVDDVDAKAKLTEELGGKVTVPPMDIPNVGRFCVISDPTGATISLIKLGGGA
ncbi:MAG TPA: VOC family protein [Pyrinomonadaceae bacterium]|jgi:predicted enzyme related to lactoylglutathione lyase|nr:VOC family protein [Pyrinomonadaceae bacterium]